MKTLGSIKIFPPLKSRFSTNIAEAGCDEAGRGCLAGPVFAAAVILHHAFSHHLLNDSKLVSEKNRLIVRDYIVKHAIAYSVASCTHEEVDSMNILNASIAAMHKALASLSVEPQFIIVDGNRFKPFRNIKHQCIVKGDSQYNAIAAASILAKTARDTYMRQLHIEYPVYQWQKNKGYPTDEHRKAILLYGLSPMHRKTFHTNAPPQAGW